ncbi:MAG: T9SS type A sorting domain-containing protein [Chitinophagales bacterium]|nr:T9SS type A sorting domain-containing protein [Chitinophagales bacterium]MBP8754590.1 T9SS type A sorting domain-containing protein [Chitinophagales bacterium]MBP9190389.1 T9SS type A sorting domain-containing protein [Chitinophagales bacterium]MBP9549280.1 T9SS type A sorting domain-containing protein [Chitinophagales bacterium]MBP9705343.1 T9SS type A sorting domain-containing protein [Chitinophagales bacterium]
MKQILLLTIAALLSCYGFSQNRAINWAFGDSAGLNFATEPPTPFLTSIKTFEPCATISDEDGNLLFYTNSRKIWNREHNVMINGDHLENGPFELSSTTQGTIILPDPGDNDRYYIINLNFPLNYSIVNMTLDSGFGAIEVDAKNIAFDTSFYTTQKMQAVRHANGRDWWLIVQGLPEGGSLGFGLPFPFYEFIVSPEGIIGPQVQEGAVYEDQNAIVSIGQMKFNQQGTMVASTNGRSVIIYNFDRCSGYLSHYATIDSVFLNNNGDYLYGLEFSPNSKRLYITKEGVYGKAYLYQYTLDSIENIKATEEIIYINLDTGVNKKILSQLQLAKDNKIYISLVGMVIPSTTLCVINDPDIAGTECNFDLLSVNIGSRIVTNALPNMPNYNLGVMEKSGCDTIGTTAINTININALQLYPNPAHNYIYLKQAPSGMVQIHIVDIYGKEVLHFNQQSTDVINISTLPSGLYFITIAQENAMLITQKLVVER